MKTAAGLLLCIILAAVVVAAEFAPHIALRESKGEPTNFDPRLPYCERVRMQELDGGITEGRMCWEPKR